MPTHLDLEEAMAISEMAFLPCRGITDANVSDASYALRVEDETGAALLTIATLRAPSTATRCIWPGCSNRRDWN
ncbi:hypothetical protein [Stutzerimonas nitrititolerans]|uniref:hypothetical protein n=1 Tax=Stutzerimonas nitrititolerans TaxID=2482751 RepID=UPI0035E3D67A